MLIWLHPDDKPKTTEDIDKYVSAEIPNPEQDREGYAAVEQFMIHGPCGVHNRDAQCMVDKRCSRHFPKR